jgi:hypothetical protein
MNEDKAAAEARPESPLNTDAVRRAVEHISRLAAIEAAEKRAKSLEDANAAIAQDYAYLSLAHTALTVDSLRAKSEATKRADSLRVAFEALKARNAELGSDLKSARSEASKVDNLEATLRTAASEVNRWFTLASILASKIEWTTPTMPPHTPENLLEFLREMPEYVIELRTKFTERGNVILELERTVRDHETTIAALRSELADKVDKANNMQSKVELYDVFTSSIASVRTMVREFDQHPELSFYNADARKGLDAVREFVGLPAPRRVIDEVAL